MSYAPGRLSRFFALLAIVAMAATGTIMGQADAAYAADYPSWSDVQKARGSEAAKKNQVVEIQALLKQLEANVIAAEVEAEKKGQEYYEAQLAYDEAAYKAEQLQKQADAAQAEADIVMRKAGQIAAQQQRVGGNELSANLFFNEDGADSLLSQLGMASKVSQQSTGIYAKAKQAQNSAQSLTDQADVAKEALKGLADVAQRKMIEAQKAAQAAAAAVEEQAANKTRLEVQLASLVQNRIVTEAQFRKGETIRIEAERRRAAEEQRKRAAAAAAGGGGGGGGGNAGSVSSGGWALPAAGHVSSSFGYRIPPTAGASSYHAGTDIGARCGYNIYATHSGRVIYAGYNGGYGNFIKIDHGGGVTSGYAHIQGGGIHVGYGQQVSAGQVIGKVGTTGTSTGCHLHFEIRFSGSAQDPVAFLRSKGVL